MKRAIVIAAALGLAAGLAALGLKFKPRAERTSYAALGARFKGPLNLVWVFHSEVGNPSDLPVIERRFKSLGLTARTRLSGPELTVEVDGVGPDASALRSVVTTRGRIDVRAVSKDQDPLPPGKELPEGVRRETDRLGPFLSAESSAALDSVVPGNDVRLFAKECAAGSCRLWAFDPHGSLEGLEIRAAAVRPPTEYSPTEGLELDLEATSAKAFLDFTGRNVGQRVGFLLDDEVQMVPVVNEAIPGGKLWLSFGQGASVDGEWLAFLLSSGHLYSRWTLQSEARR